MLRELSEKSAIEYFEATEQLQTLALFEAILATVVFSCYHMGDNDGACAVYLVILRRLFFVYSHNFVLIYCILRRKYARIMCMRVQLVAGLLLFRGLRRRLIRE